MISLTDLCLDLGELHLERLTLAVETGEYAILMGRTGSGKTTLLECICGLRRPRSGSIHLRGRDVTALVAANREIGYVPQDLALFPTLCVRDHLAFALTVRGWSAAAIEGRAREMAHLLGIAHLLHRFPQGLSGGEAQRVALGRALAFRPSVLLLDEPLASLDDATRSEMIALLRTAQRTTQVTTLHVTHSLDEARQLADRLFLLENGKVREVPLERPVRESAPREPIRKAET
jgi:ABC-type sugar transport system ATPase subunit